MSDRRDFWCTRDDCDHDGTTPCSDAPDLLDRLQASLEKARANRKSSIVDDITRAMSTISAAEPNYWRADE